MKELIAHSALLRTTVRERKINTHTRFITQDVHLVEHLIHSVWTKPFFFMASWNQNKIWDEQKSSQNHKGRKLHSGLRREGVFTGRVYLNTKDVEDIVQWNHWQNLSP